MPSRRSRRYWSSRVLGDQLEEARAKDTRIVAADLDTAVDTAIDTAADTPAGTASSRLPAGN